MISKPHLVRISNFGGENSGVFRSSFSSNKNEYRLKSGSDHMKVPHSQPFLDEVVRPALVFCRNCHKPVRHLDGNVTLCRIYCYFTNISFYIDISHQHHNSRSTTSIVQLWTLYSPPEPYISPRPYIFKDRIFYFSGPYISLSNR